MPSHILCNGLGLTYKSTVGISTATIPDVCKTPSPGGPVPIPYPNIAQQSSLKGGTTTVKAKNNMIAVKGSQYGSSNGDEAGTAGGVKSSVNMKATDWITYSFDVKLDGKNACRHTDKKFHNNQNTVDMGGNADPSTWTDDEGNFCLDCDNASHSGEELDDCQKEEVCAKIKVYDDAVKGKKGPKISKTRSDLKKKRRKTGNNRCKSINYYARDGRGVGGEGVPEDMGFHDVSEDCLEELQEHAADNDYVGYSPDHVIEIQHNGHPTDLGNLVWMSSGANEWSGSCMKGLKTSGANKHTGVKGTCCEGEQKC